MLNKDFHNYVKEFNKDPGAFTDGEILEICLKHRALRCGKDWAELASILGVNKSPGALSVWTLRRSRSPEILAQEGDFDYQKFQELYKAKTQVRDVWNAYRRDLRSDARLDEFKALISESVSKMRALPDIKIKNAVPSTSKGAEAALLFADLHIGPEFENSYNSYSVDIAVDRVGKLINEVISQCAKHNVSTLHFLNMGDLIAGLIHPTIRLEQNVDVIEQTMIAAEIVAKALNVLAGAIPELTYRSVVDNHSRVMPDKSCNIEAENLNRIIDWYVKDRLKGTKVKFPCDNIDIGVGGFYLKNGKFLIFTHGHQDKKSSVIQDMTGLARKIPDYVCMGHYHNSTARSFQGSKLFISGSIIGTDPYAYSHRLFGAPEQKLLIFEDGGDIDIDIRLS